MAFAPTLWNVHEYHLPRTSNSIESWHRKLEVQNKITFATDFRFRIEGNYNWRKDKRVLKVLDYAPIRPKLPLTGFKLLSHSSSKKIHFNVWNCI
uniref:Uncharacterized protein n=1 Tax=Caenorhabditis japonica TaxID=281687 RepID=A0A8R1J3W9_CAEJA